MNNGDTCCRCEEGAETSYHAVLFNVHWNIGGAISTWTMCRDCMEQMAAVYSGAYTAEERGIKLQNPSIDDMEQVQARMKKQNNNQ
jgi:hypothetical protein